MKIALYYAPNTCALAPYLTLTEAGADFVALGEEVVWNAPDLAAALAAAGERLTTTEHV